MKLTCLLATCAVSLPLACPCLAQTTQSTSKPALRFTISKETTRITGPLRPDGRPDYIAAINAAHSKGVTKDNNAAVLYVQAVGPTVLGKTTAAQSAALKLLGMESPKGPFITTYADEQEVHDCASQLTRASAHPKVAEWIKANEAPLNVLVQASKRTRWYLPAIAPDDEPIAMHVYQNMPASLCDVVMNMLIIRAHFAIVDGRIPEALEDMLALARLGNLMGQGYSLSEQLDSAHCLDTANVSIARCAALDTFDRKTIKSLLDQLSVIRPNPPISYLDEWSRYMLLDSLCYASTRAPEQSVKDLEAYCRVLKVNWTLNGTPDPERASGIREAAQQSSKADWNVYLRKANGLSDIVIRGTQTSNVSKRRELTSAYLKSLKDFRGRSIEHLEQLNKKDHPQFSDVFADLIILDQSSRMLDQSVLVSEITDSTAAKHDLTLIVLALMAFKADHGSTPDRLADLAPAYLTSVPKDPFSGKDFIYRPNDEIHLVYSVGKNLKDDGGNPKDDIVSAVAR